MNPAPYNILIALQAVRGLLSVDQVAELFGKSSATIYRMAQKRQIPSIMLGGSRMFDPSTLHCGLLERSRYSQWPHGNLNRPLNRQQRETNGKGQNESGPCAMLMHYDVKGAQPRMTVPPCRADPPVGVPSNTSQW